MKCCMGTVKNETQITVNEKHLWFCTSQDKRCNSCQVLNMHSMECEAHKGKFMSRNKMAILSCHHIPGTRIVLGDILKSFTCNPSQYLKPPGYYGIIVY